MIHPAPLTELLESQGHPAFRSRQILHWIYQQRTTDWEQMSNLPANLRRELAEAFPLRPLRHVLTKGSQDTTRKFLFELPDERYIETVLIPASPALYGERSDRFTLCVSSQVGCAFGCKFCASGLDGLTRNLTATEIITQIFEAERLSGQRVTNLVFMGMGEPLANLSNLRQALDMIHSPWGLDLGARRITLSTSGLAPQIEKLATYPAQIRLAISLHGPDDATRDQIMPVNQRFNLERLFEALKVWRRHKKQKITLEYILIDGVNSTLEHADLLTRRARSISAKVNLIPYNTVEGLPWKRPSEARCRAFAQTLKDGGIPTTLRLEKGHDISAACGQLRLKKERERTS